MRKIFIPLLITLVVVVNGGIALAAKPDTAATLTGNDISWPQCNKSLPKGQSFGIVGVNGGLANTTNPCLTAQLKWAAGSLGTATQPKVQLYVNTANPGGLGTASWPHNNVDAYGVTAPNPYDSCDNSDSLACAWQYGWNRAAEDVKDRFAPAVQNTILDTNPAAYTWWLDIETENTWKGNDSAGQASNRADIEGMVAYFKDKLGAPVGLYSTSYQLGQIAGQVNSNSSLSNLLSWIPGARNQQTAKSNCSASPLTPGSPVVLTQYISGSLDYDFPCN